MRRAIVLTLVVLAAALAVGLVTGRLPGSAQPVAVELSPSPSAPATPAPPPSPSPTPSPPPVPRRLDITTHPPGAAVTIVASTGATQTGVTPFSGMVEGGDAEIALALDGYNPVTRLVPLDRDRSIDLWLDPAGLLHHKHTEFATGPGPKQVTFTPDGRELWVTLLAGEGVEVFDPLTGQRLAAIDLGEHGAVELIFSADGSTAYASQMETASVWEIDRATYTVRRQLAGGGSWSKVVALSPDASTLFLANWSSDDVSEIDLATGQLRRRIPTVTTPRGLYPTADGRLFVAGYENGEVQRINLADGSSQVLLSTGGAMRHLVGDPARGLLYANDMGTDEAYVIDLASEQARLLAPTNSHPNTTDLTPDGRVLYVSNRGVNNPESYYLPGPEWGSVLAIDTTSGAVLDAIVGGNQTTGLDVSPDGRLLAFSDLLDDRVQIYEIPPHATLAAGGGGRASTHLADLPKQ
jgi:DNA-binding beta-propeller fold protein YncE